MASLTNILTDDPTLLAIDMAIEKKAAEEKPRCYLGMSSIGEECWRYLWYGFRQAYKKAPKAFLTKCAERGHRAEELQAERLRMVDGVNLLTKDASGQQIAYSDIDGHFRGHCDGVIDGLLQAPKTKHIWEHKEKEQKFVNEFNKIKAELGEKQALKKWSPVYYAQGVLYMFFGGLSRHYLTVTVPGGREAYSARTESNEVYALQLRNKAKRIVYSNEAFEKIGNAELFKCKMCDARQVCHGGQMAERGCRTCLHSSPIDNGQWRCERFGRNLTFDEQLAGCPAHLYLPALVPGEILSTTESSVTYKLSNGNIFVDSESNA